MRYGTEGLLYLMERVRLRSEEVVNHEEELSGDRPNHQKKRAEEEPEACEEEDEGEVTADDEASWCRRTSFRVRLAEARESDLRCSRHAPNEIVKSRSKGEAQENDEAKM